MSNDSNSTFSNFIVAAGVILAVSYPVLAISTGFRAIFQIMEGESVNSPWLTLLGALCYTVATVGFAKQPRDTQTTEKSARTALGKWWQALTPETGWRISVYVLAFESVMTIVVGGLSVAGIDVFGRNVWQFFGADYGYLPLIQPLLGILWLFNPVTMRRYGIR